MIADHISNAARYQGLGPLLSKALSYVQETDFSVLENGRYDIEGDRLFALVQSYNTKLLEDGFWEAHRRYIDLQFLVQGTERIGYAPLFRMNLDSYDESRDLAVLQGDGEYLTLTEGCFMVLWPEDAHMPGIQAQGAAPVRKVVFKIAVE